MEYDAGLVAKAWGVHPPKQVVSQALRHEDDFYLTFSVGRDRGTWRGVAIYAPSHKKPVIFSSAYGDMGEAKTLPETLHRLVRNIRRHDDWRGMILAEEMLKALTNESKWYEAFIEAYCETQKSPE